MRIVASITGDRDGNRSRTGEDSWGKIKENGGPGRRESRVNEQTDRQLNVVLIEPYRERAVVKGEPVVEPCRGKKKSGEPYHAAKGIVSLWAIHRTMEEI